MELYAISRYNLMHVFHHLFTWQSPTDHPMEKNPVDGHCSITWEEQHPFVVCRFSTCSTGRLENRALGFAHPPQWLLHAQETIRIIFYYYIYHWLRNNIPFLALQDPNISITKFFYHRMLVRHKAFTGREK